MNPQSAKTVYDEIEAHMNKQGGPYSAWYCGIASDWRDRLFNDHQVPRKDHWYIARQCNDDTDARNVEQALLKLGCEGGGGGGDRTTVSVYAYLKSRETNP